MMGRTGRQLGNYRLLQLLGNGGFADVYLGEHIYLKTRVAIKVLHAQLTHDSENFYAEARLIASLAHPHIVRVLDFGVENTIPYLVMEYAPNGTLRQRHTRGSQLPLPLIVSFTWQIAGALQYAHDQRLIHRDVKPENMLLGQKNEVLLSDFGIATIAHTSRSLHTQDISGTIAYMAPEQVQGKPRPASDQYSLGIIVYEWLTGHCPFRGSFAEIASQQIYAPPPSLRASYPAIPAEVEQVLMIALAKNPDTRFTRVEAFAYALEQAIQPGLTTIPNTTPNMVPPSSNSPAVVAIPPAEFSASVAPLNTDPTYIPIHALNQPLPGKAPPAPSPIPPETRIDLNIAARSRRGISRRTLLGGLLSLAVVAGGGIAAFMTLRSQTSSGNSTVASPTPRPTTQPTSAPSPQATPQPDPRPTTAAATTNTAFTYQGPYKEFTVTWSPDGRAIASAGNGLPIQVWDPTTGNILFDIHTHSTPIYSVAWSPDGTKIASGHSDGTISIWDATSGNFIIALTGHTSQVNSVAWSPGSSHIVSGSGDKTAKVWDISTGQSLITYRGHASWINAVAWSPDGIRIVSGSGDRTAQVWDASSGSLIITYSGHSNEVVALAWSPDSGHIASASDDTTVQVWDVASGTTLVTYSGHTDYVVAVSWSRDTQRIASGSRDRTVRVWYAVSGNPIYTYTGHHNEVEGVAWSPDGIHVASASDDTTVQVWQVP